jgi:hypothetical protein
MRSTFELPRRTFRAVMAASLAVVGLWLASLGWAEPLIRRFFRGELFPAAKRALQTWYRQQGVEDVDAAIAANPELAEAYTEKYTRLLEVVLFDLFLVAVFFAAYLLADRLVRGGLTRALQTGFARAAEHPRRLLAVLVLGALGLLALTGSAVMLESPNTVDEFVYTWQADTLAAGRLWNEPPPMEPLFGHNHMAVEDGRWVGRFPPGWPAALALAKLVGLPGWLLNPLLGAATVALLFLVARRRAGEGVACLAALGLLTTPFFVFNSSSFFSHTFCGLLLLLFCLFGLRALDEGRARDALVAGLFVGLAFDTRYFTALLFGLVYAAHLLARRRLGGLGLAALTGLGALPGVLLLLVYNWKITGDPFLLVTTWVEPEEGLGFAKGHNITTAIARDAYNLVDLSRWAAPVFVVGYFWALWSGLRTRTLAFTGALLAVVIVAHGLYHIGWGPRLGPRLWYEGFLLAVPFVTTRAFPDRESLALPGTARTLFVVSVCAMVWMLPWHAAQQHRKTVQWRDVDRAVAEEGLEDAIVFLRSGVGLDWYLMPTELTRNDVDLEQSVLFVLDRGTPERQRELLEHFPGRTLWVYERARDQVRGRVRPYEGR